MSRMAPLASPAGRLSGRVVAPAVSPLANAEIPPFVFGWIADRDLLILVERLPLVQRQVLLLRFMLDLPAAEVGEILGRSPVEVRKLQHRAMIFLRERLAALGRTPRSGDRIRSPWRRRKAQVGVLRERRFALVR